MAVISFHFLLQSSEFYWVFGIFYSRNLIVCGGNSWCPLAAKKSCWSKKFSSFLKRLWLRVFFLFSTGKRDCLLKKPVRTPSSFRLQPRCGRQTSTTISFQYSSLHLVNFHFLRLCTLHHKYSKSNFQSPTSSPPVSSLCTRWQWTPCSSASLSTLSRTMEVRRSPTTCPPNWWRF